MVFVARLKQREAPNVMPTGRSPAIPIMVQWSAAKDRSLDYGNDQTKFGSVIQSGRPSHMMLEKNILPGAIFTVFCVGAVIGQAIAMDTRIPLMSFTGSSKVGLSVQQTVNKRFGKCLLELHGNNAIVIMDDAEIELVAIAATVDPTSKLLHSVKTKHTELLLLEQNFESQVPCLKVKHSSVTVWMHSAFIRASKEILDLETELSLIRSLLATLINNLAEGVHIDSLFDSLPDSTTNSSSNDEISEPSDIENWLTEFPDHLDVLLAIDVLSSGWNLDRDDREQPVYGHVRCLILFPKVKVLIQRAKFVNECAGDGTGFVKARVLPYTPFLCFILSWTYKALHVPA
nr:aldehyde dehydrogenase family 7 member B4 [Ipomoea batatas]